MNQNNLIMDIQLRNLIGKIVLHSVLYLTLLFSGYGSLDAQILERENTIDTKLFPTYNSDFSYFFLRKDMNMHEQLFSTEMITHQDGAIDIRTKGFIPLFKNDKWSYSIPVYFDRYRFVEEGSENSLNVSNLFGQSLLVYRPNEKWDLLHIFEFRFKGANDYFIRKEGNFMAQFMTAQYNINDQFSIIAGGLTGIGWDHLGDSYVDIKPALMFKWHPSKYLKLMLGVPGSAIEWSAPAGFDFMAHALLEGSDVNVSTAIRKNIGNAFGITLRYLREGFDGLYTPGQAVDFLAGSGLTEISQYQNKLQVELTVRPEPNTIIQLLVGHGKDRNLETLDSENIKTSFNASDGLYVGINLARVIDLK